MESTQHYCSNMKGKYLLSHLALAKQIALQNHGMYQDQKP